MKADVIEAQGLKLRLWDHDAASSTGSPCALFVHGYLDTGRSFDDVAAAMPGVRTLALDLRGHGESDRVGAGGAYHLLDHMKDVALVLDALEKRGTPADALVGHSMGGNIALLVAGARPALVKQLVLLDSAGPPPEDSAEQSARLGELVQSVLQPKRAFSTVASIEAAAEKIRAQNNGLSLDGARRMVRNVMRPNDDGTLAFPFDPRLRGPSPVRYDEAMWLAHCARVTAPTLIVRASEGYVLEGPTLDARVAALRASVVVVEGPHHLHVEHPSKIGAIVRSRLTA